MAAQMQSVRRPGRGRPTLYNPTLGDRICDLIATGYTLKQAANTLGLQHESQIILWTRVHPEFYEAYQRARETRLELMADQLESIADEGHNDYYEREGIDGPDHEHMARSRLRVETRKWLLSKLAPKVYGDKLSAEISGKDGAPLMPAVSVVIGAATPQPMGVIEHVAEPERSVGREPKPGKHKRIKRLAQSSATDPISLNDT